MSLDAYDKAMLHKLEEVFPNVINSADQSAFSNYAEHRHDVDKMEDSDKSLATITLPLISFWRVENPLNRFGSMEGNFAMIRQGILHKPTKDTGQYLQTIPISIQYQVSIWSDKRKEVDDIYRELLMFLSYDEPYLRVKVEYEDVTEDFTLNITDTSTDIDTSSFTDSGRMYRQDIILEIDNAKLWYKGREFSPVKNIPIRTFTIKEKHEKQGAEG